MQTFYPSPRGQRLPARAADAADVAFRVAISDDAGGEAAPVASRAHAADEIAHDPCSAYASSAGFSAGRGPSTGSAASTSQAYPTVLAKTTSSPRHLAAGGGPSTNADRPTPLATPKDPPALGSTERPGKRVGSGPAAVGDSLDTTWQERLVTFGTGDVQGLLGLVDHRVLQLSPLSLATALHRVAGSAAGREQRGRCEGLLSRIDEVLQSSPEAFRAQSLANMTWAMARLQWSCSQFLKRLSVASMTQLVRFKSAELSMVVWGVASFDSAPLSLQLSVLEAVVNELQRRGPAAFDAQSLATITYTAGLLTLPASDPFWPVISAGSEDRIDEFSDRQVANLVWAFATAAHSDSAAPLCARVESAWAQHVRDLAPIDLSLVAWAMAKLCQGQAGFYAEVAAAVVAKKPAWQTSDTRNIATLIYAFALAGYAPMHDAAIRVLADAVSSRLGDFVVQGLTNAVWGYATASYTEQAWFASVALELERRAPSEFEPLDISNCLWSFATVPHNSAPTIAYLKSLGRASLGGFTAQNLAITLWSFATLEARDQGFFEHAADCFVQRLPECKSQELNNTLWACATANVRLPWLFIKADAHALQLGLAEFKVHELSITLWAHGVAGVCNHVFFDAVVDEILERRGIWSCTPREVANTAWAYSTIIGRAHAPWMAAVAAFSCARMTEFDMQCIGNTLWAFTAVGVCSEPLFKVACREMAARCVSDISDATLNVAQVLGAVSATRFVDAPFLDAMTDCFLRHDGGVGARELVVLGNAMLPARRAVARWPAFEAVLRERVLGPLLVAAPRKGSIDAWSSFEACVSDLDLDHLGVFYTARFLLEAGVASQVHVLGAEGVDVGIDGLRPGGAWAAAAAQACVEERARLLRDAAGQEQPQKISRQLDKVNKREIVAWVSFEVSLASSGAERIEPGCTFHWRPDIEEQAAPLVFTAAALRPLVTRSRQGPTNVGEHDRSGHAERGALLQVASCWLGFASGVGQEVRGKLRLYVTHFPCISCLCVLAQFARLFPNVSLTIGYADGRATACRSLESMCG